MLKLNPVLLDFPTEFTTERLIIRMPLPGDGQAVHDAIIHSLPELKQWMIFAQKEQSLEVIETNVREAYVNFLKRSDLRLHVFSKETGDFVASSGLHRIDWSIPKFEIGYWINSSYSGKGYMSEAVQGITDFAVKELKAKRIEIRCDSKNSRSRAVAERLGYTLEGILRNNAKSVANNDLIDTCIYAKIF